MGLPLSLSAWKTFQNQGIAYEEAFKRCIEKQSSTIQSLLFQ